MKRNLTLILLLCFLLPLSISAQWREAFYGADTSNSITGLSFYTAKEGFVAFRKNIGYTADSGHTMIRRYVSYNNVDYNGYSVNLLFSFSPSGIHAFNANNVILYGDYGFEPSILYSSNGGQTWKLVYHRNIRPDGSYLFNAVSDMEFPSDNLTGFAVQGDEILKTTDGGQNWQTVRYDYDQQLKKISFTSASAGFASSEKRLLKTTDGGYSWTVLNPLQSMRDIAFTSSSNGFIFTDFGYVFNSKDGGITWEQMNADINKIYSNDVHFINDSTGYITSSAYAVYKTNNRGRSWEVMKGSTSYQYSGFGFNSIFFYNNSIAWTGGDREYLSITSNGGGTNSPVALFYANTSEACTSNTVYLENYSAAGYTYQWFRNETLISSAYNTSYTAGAGNDVIKLVVSNGIESDTSIQTINAQSNSEFSFVSIPSTTAICNAGIMHFTIPDSDPGAIYQVWRSCCGYSTSAQGNGDTLTLWFASNYDDNGLINVEIRGSKNTSCGTKSSHHVYAINVINPNISVAATTDTFCPQGMAPIKIANSRKDYAYWADYGQPKVFGNDSTITIYASAGAAVFVGYPIDEYHREYTFKINVQHVAYGCQTAVADVVAMSHTNRALFNMFGNAYFTKDTLRFLNQSGSSDSYYWSLDNSASGKTLTSYNPADITYNAEGQKSIKLIAYTSEGCKDSATKTIEIFRKSEAISTLDLCRMGSSAGDTVEGKKYYYPRDLYADEHGNIYVTGGHVSFDISNFFPRGFEGWFASKFDRNGNLKWRLEQKFDYFYVPSYDNNGHIITEQVVSDQSGNAFIFGHSNGHGYIKDSINTFALPFTCSFLMKINDKGQIEWLKTFYNNSAFGGNSGQFTGGTLLRGGNNDLFLLTNVDGGNFYMDNQRITAWDTVKLTGIIMHLDMNSNLLGIKQYPSYYNTIRTGYQDHDNYDRIPKGVFNKQGQIVFYVNLNPTQITDNKIDGVKIKMNLKNVISALLTYDTSSHLISAIQPVYDIDDRGRQVTSQPLAFAVDSSNNYYTSSRTFISLLASSQTDGDDLKPKGVITRYDVNGSKVWTKLGTGFDGLSMQVVKDKLFVLAQNYVGEGYNLMAMIHYGNESTVFPQTKQLSSLHDSDSYIGNGVTGNGSMDVVVARLSTSDGAMEAARVFGSEKEQETGILKKGVGDQIFLTGSGDYQIRSSSELDQSGLYFIAKVPVAHNCDSSDVLPLKLLEFNASRQYKTARLKWQTENEYNIAYFNVQRSYHAINFIDIGKVYAKNNYSLKNSYSFDDNIAGYKAKKIYYRLQIIDKDGAKSYSKVQSIDLDQFQDFSIYPNPASKYFIVTHSGNSNEGQGVIIVKNTLGQTFIREPLSPIAGQKINISNLPKGPYFVTVVTDNEIQQTIKLIIQ